MVVIHVQVMRTPNISAVDLLRVLESLAVRRLLMSRLVGFSIPENSRVDHCRGKRGAIKLNATHTDSAAVIVRLVESYKEHDDRRINCLQTGCSTTISDKGE